MKRRFVTVLVLLALCVGFALPVGAYDEARPLPALTGDQAKDIVAIAISQLGYTENNGTVYGAWWETQITWEHDYTHEAWCGMFAAWCADKAGAGMGKAYDNNAALANGMFNWLKNNAKWDTSFLTDPKPGDFIFFIDTPHAESDDRADHVAIVVDYNETTKVVTFVGGNQSGGRVTQNTCLWSPEGMYGSQQVLGYGRPNYKTATLTYMDRCTRYPTYRTLRISRNTTLYSQPCTPAENAKSTLVTTLSAGQTVTAVGMYQNPGGGCWYQIIHNGVTCYLFAKDTSTVAALYTDLTVKDISAPYMVKKGAAFYIGGTLRTSYNSIYTVTAEVKRPGTTVLKGSAVVNNRTYSLKYSPVDDGLTFTKLENGDYLYVLNATILNYYSTDGRTVRSDSFTKQLYSGAFRVSDTGKEKPSTFTITFDANGGECEVKTRIYEYGKTFCLMPTAKLEGYVFDGWYTAKTGGVEMTSAHMVTAAQTLYARWSCAHEWKQTAHTDPDCLKAGQTQYHCDRCGEDRSEVEQALGHDWEVSGNTELDCVTDEAILYSCLRCAEEKTEVIQAAPGHSWKEEKVTHVSCTTDEAVYEFCTECHAEQVRVLEKAWKHDWENRICRTCGQEMTNPFADVTEDRYYYESVLWALYDGVTTGMDATHFGPDLACTRAQVVTFLWRAAGSPRPAATKSAFADVAAGSYYETAVLWAVEQGITQGMSETSFDPNGICTRAQVATFLWRAKGSPDPGTAGTAFADLDPKGFYYKAVLWAVEQGVTQGMSETSFAPSGQCTRAQIVTFLKRAQ